MSGALNLDFRTSPTISIITATFNRLDLTREYVIGLDETLAGFPLDYEVIMVDDASTDGTQRFLRELGDPYRIEFNETNRGYAYSNNKGAGLARGDFVFLLNNDLVLKGGWIEPMLHALRSDSSLGAVGNVQFQAQTRLIEHAGVFFDLVGLPHHARKARKTVPRNPIVEWPAVTAACLGIRRKVFWEVGGFDEIYTNGYEDIDLCLKLRRAGYRNIVCNRSVVFHHVSSSPGSHKFKAENSRVFMDRWQTLTREIGKQQWPGEYFRRYARQWWRCNPLLALKAATMLSLGIIAESLQHPDFWRDHDKSR